jgi:3-phosphoshikimate 1-carboxyvinyltransferase
VDLVEPGRSRDHTEKAFSGLGVGIESGPVPGGWHVTLPDPPPGLSAFDLRVPGDFSSAAFFIAFGLLRDSGGPLVIRNVGLNPTRTGLLPVLKRMGARIEVENRSETARGGEPSGDLLVWPSRLRGGDVGAPDIPGLIDEVPVLAALSARAEGTTRITGARELRVKETDRIRAMVENLRAVGVQVDELEDGLEVAGGDQPLRGTVQSFDDHRIAMAFGVLGALPDSEIRVLGEEAAGVSFPGFKGLLADVSHSSGPGKALP